MDLELAGKIAIVTGGGSGLGAAICEGFCREGADVVMNYVVDEPVACSLAGDLARRHGVRCLPLYGDISRGDDIDRVIDEAERALGPADVLVNNAGVWPTARIIEMTDEEWERTLRINLTGTFMSSKRMVQRWVARGAGGRIVNIVSQAAFHGSTSGHAHYAAAKAGVVNLTVSMAREVAANGIRVNAVAPGIMTTPLMKDALADRMADYLARIPVGRIATPDEVAAVVVFLASPRADYMTGATVDVTGGMLMR